MVLIIYDSSGTLSSRESLTVEHQGPLKTVPLYLSEFIVCCEHIYVPFTALGRGADECTVLCVHQCLILYQPFCRCPLMQ